MSKKIFITGAFKTATSSMLAAINTHPDFYVMFELFDTPKMRKRFLEFYKDAIFMNDPKNSNRKRFYSEAEKFIKAKGFGYKYFGDKIAVSDKTMCYQTLKELNELSDYIIFMIRDVRHWTAKMTRMEKQIKYFSQNANISEMIEKYILYFIHSYKINCLRIKTEDLINTNNTWIDQVSKYTKENFKDCAKKWWKSYTPGKADPKSFNWWKKHKSSAIKPGKKDVFFELSNHSFWKELLPVFDKYYKNLNIQVNEKQINKDINRIKEITVKYNNLQQSDLFDYIKYIDILSGKVIKEVRFR